MKKKEISKKLMLSKQTVVNLEIRQMDNVRGGTEFTFDMSCGYCDKTRNACYTLTYVCC